MHEDVPRVCFSVDSDFPSLCFGELTLILHTVLNCTAGSCLLVNHERLAPHSRQIQSPCQMYMCGFWTPPCYFLPSLFSLVFATVANSPTMRRGLGVLVAQPGLTRLLASASEVSGTASMPPPPLAFLKQSLCSPGRPQTCDLSFSDAGIIDVCHIKDVCHFGFILQPCGN